MKEKRKIKALIVDDSDIIRSALKVFLEDYDIETFSCVDGLEGIKYASDIKPDFIILDIMMPNFDGLKMLKVLKSLNDLKDIPVIVISANTDKKNVLEAIASGASKVLTKPLQKDLLVKAINEIIGEEVLSKEKRQKMLSEQEKENFLKELLAFFLKNYPLKKSDIEASLRMRMREKLIALIHELKGNGGSIGHMFITQKCALIEQALKDLPVDWEFVENNWKEVDRYITSLYVEYQKNN